MALPYAPQYRQWYSGLQDAAPYQSQSQAVAQEGWGAFEGFANGVFNDMFPGMPGYGQSYQEFLRTDRPYQQAVENAGNVPTMEEIFALMNIPEAGDIRSQYASAMGRVPRTAVGDLTGQVRGEFENQLAGWRGGLPDLPTGEWLSSELDRIGRGQAAQSDQARIGMQQALRASGVAPGDPRFAALTQQAATGPNLAANAAMAQSRAAAEQMANQMALQISGQELGLRGQALGGISQAAAQELAQQLGEAGTVGQLTSAQFNDLLARAGMAGQAQFTQQGLQNQTQQAMQSAAGQAAATYGMGPSMLGQATGAFGAATGLPLGIMGMNQAEYLTGINGLLQSLLGLADVVPDASTVMEPWQDMMSYVLGRNAMKPQGGGSFNFGIPGLFGYSS